MEKYSRILLTVCVRKKGPLFKNFSFFASYICAQNLWRLSAKEMKPRCLQKSEPSREPNKIVWLRITSIQVTTFAPGVLFFVICSLYVILWSWNYIEKIYFQYTSYERVHLNNFFFSFEKIKVGDFLAS